jgi:hypothetical protein
MLSNDPLIRRAVVELLLAELRGRGLAPPPVLKHARLVLELDHELDLWRRFALEADDKRQHAFQCLRLPRTEPPAAPPQETK